LKETLDNLSKRLDLFTKERQRDRDALRGSVTLFARDVRKQAERVMMVQSTANLAEARRNLPSASMHHAMPQQNKDGQDVVEQEAKKRIAELEEQLRVARAEADKQVCTDG
jgi:isoaspartyl peptidase/L-asparaginase-like protein (Ntn-hydrolase superfamily)